jgi:DNA invertase Pin-like site-specific DNA recombinase
MPENSKPSGQPAALAYLRFDDDSAHDRFAALLQDIAVCCQNQGLRLARIFTDRGYDGRTLARPGLAELQEALKDRPGLVVVVPTLDHLSPSELIRVPLLRMAQQHGGRLLVANEPDDRMDDDAVQRGQWVDLDGGSAP